MCTPVHSQPYFVVVFNIYLGKKKSKFKTFKKFFGKKKRKESPSSTGSSAWKQSQAKSEVIAIESGPVGYESEDELE